MGPGGAVSNGASATPPRPPIHAAPRRVALTVAGALFMEGFDSAVT